MNTQRRISPSLFLLITTIGLLAGGAIVQKNTQVAEAASREQGLIAIQSARGAMDLIKDDMARAGYTETRPASHDVAVRVSHGDALQVTKAFGNVLAFRAPNGDEIVYEVNDGRLTREAKGANHFENQVLLGNARDFEVRSVNDGQAVNLAFWIPVGSPADSKANQAPAYAHFVR